MEAFDEGHEGVVGPVVEGGLLAGLVGGGAGSAEGLFLEGFEQFGDADATNGGPVEVEVVGAVGVGAGA